MRERAGTPRVTLHGDRRDLSGHGVLGRELYVSRPTAAVMVSHTEAVQRHLEGGARPSYHSLEPYLLKDSGERG